jgi:hypothetical protein
MSIFTKEVLPTPPRPHENQLGFIQRLGAGALREIVGEDFLRGLGPLVWAPWAKHFRGNAQVWVPME